MLAEGSDVRFGLFSTVCRLENFAMVSIFSLTIRVVVLLCGAGGGDIFPIAMRFWDLEFSGRGLVFSMVGCGILVLGMFPIWSLLVLPFCFFLLWLGMPW